MIRERMGRKKNQHNGQGPRHGMLVSEKNTKLLGVGREQGGREPWGRTIGREPFLGGQGEGLEILTWILWFPASPTTRFPSKSITRPDGSSNWPSWPPCTPKARINLAFLSKIWIRCDPESETNIFPSLIGIRTESPKKNGGCKDPRRPWCDGHLIRSSLHESLNQTVLLLGLKKGLEMKGLGEEKLPINCNSTRCGKAAIFSTRATKHGYGTVGSFKFWSI